MTDYQFILTEILATGAGLVRLNRPKELNALNSVLMEELVTALEAFDRQPGIGCLVIAGSERRAFYFLFSTAGQKEGMRVFIEERPASWQGA